jgi:predicted aspartyl protease/outer membrane murein-binding lipoprotein Lpp
MHQSSSTGSWSSIRACRIHAESWAVAGVVWLLTGCLETAAVANLQSDVKPVTSTRKLLSEEYWTAVSGLDLAASRKAARGEPQIRFARAVALFAAGDYERAESAFIATRAQRTDLTVAATSHAMLAATLWYQRKWAALRDLSTNPQLGLTDQPNVSELEQWGRAFASLDPQITRLPDQPVTLPLGVTAIGTPMVRVLINGKEFEFWFDTGSTITVLSSNVAAAARVSTLTQDVLSVRTFAGAAEVRPAMVGRIEIGSIVIANSPAIVMDAALMRVKAGAKGVPRTGLPIAGIIGWDTIRQFDIALDYKKRMITLRRPETLGTRGTTYQNLTWVGKPLVQVRTSLGEMRHFTLDTGSQTSFVNALIVKEAGIGMSSLYMRVFGIAANGGQTARVVPYLQLEAGGKSLLLKDLMVYAPPSSGLVSCDGILGSDIAQFGTIRIDATNGLFTIGA